MENKLNDNKILFRIISEKYEEKINEIHKYVRGLCVDRYRDEVQDCVNFLNKFYNENTYINRVEHYDYNGDVLGITGNIKCVIAAEMNRQLVERMIYFTDTMKKVELKKWL